MRQRLAVVLAGAMALVSPLRASDRHKPSNDVRSALEFFEGHGDLSIDEFLGRMRPPPLDAIERAGVIAAMPQGAIGADARALAQMSLAEQVLAYHGRRGGPGLGSSPKTDGETARAHPAPSPWPCQLVIDQNLRPFVDTAWDSSATFRHQCRTLGAARARVVVTAASPWEFDRASAQIAMSAQGTVFARVRVRLDRDTNIVELIAHEIEHVLERVEGNQPVDGMAPRSIERETAVRRCLRNRPSHRRGPPRRT